MRIALLTILFLTLTANVFSQFIDIDPLKRMDKDSLKIINAQFDSSLGVQIIPDDALTGRYDLLITGSDRKANESIKTNKIEISWSSNYIDGHYSLVITPRQIYLRSGHDNPNPNFLYWLTNISEKQFLLIKDCLIESESTFIHNYTNENSPCLTYSFTKAKIEKHKEKDWTNMRYDNFKTLMTRINKRLSQKGEKINIPTKKDFNEIRKLRILIDIGELQDQIKLIKIE